jgi:hypothetical protein
LFIFVIPGLAFFPKFFISPRTAAIIPFLSISIIGISQYILSLINQFNRLSVLSLIVLFVLIAVVRLNKIYKLKLKNSWGETDLIALILICFSSAPLMIILGFDAFQHADEVTSWNLWAKEIYFENEVSFENTKAAYPLLLPSLIAFCYKFIGNIDYQLPIKFAFSILYLSTVLILFSFTSNNKQRVGFFFITYIIVFLILGVGFEYKKVWADTVMTGLLVSSLALLISLSRKQNTLNRNISSNSILVASTILICSASLTKQAAIPWTMFIYPLLAFLFISQNISVSKNLKYLLFAPISTPIIWYFLSGRGFQNNIGVVSSSMHERNYYDQFIYGFQQVFISEGRVILLLFMIIVFIVLVKNINIEKIILSIGIIISTILLIFFGAYDPTRLYLHVILSGYLIIFSYGESIFNNKFGIVVSKIGNNIFTYLLVGSMLVFWSLNSFNDRMSGMTRVSNYLDGREVQANWIFGENGAEQYRNILGSNQGLWGEDNHVQGIYFGLDIFQKGELNHPDFNFVIERIIDKNIGWVYTKGSKHLDLLEQSCKDSITKIETKSYSENNLYRISLNELISCTQVNNLL